MRNSKGFTLIETLVAIFILVLTIGTLMSLSASSFFSVRYAKNQITASNLVQAQLEFIRNVRDTKFNDYYVEQGQAYGGFPEFIQSFVNYCTNSYYKVCHMDPIYRAGGFLASTNENDFFPIYYFKDTGEYAMVGYRSVDNQLSTNMTPSPFSIQTKFVKHSDDMVEAIVSIRWKNGLIDRTLTQSMILTNLIK